MAPFHLVDEDPARHIAPHFRKAGKNLDESLAWVTRDGAQLMGGAIKAAQEMFAKHTAEQAAKTKVAE